MDVPACDRIVHGAPTDQYEQRGVLCVQSLPGGDSVVVAVGGELDIASAPGLLHDLLELLSRPVRAMTLDLSALTFVDSSGVKLLNTIRCGAEDRDVVFSLDGVQPQVRRVLEVIGMIQLFDIRVPIDSDKTDKSDHAPSAASGTART